MNESEAEAVIAVFADRLREIGEPEIAEQDDLVFRSDDGIVRRYDPRKRLVLMIQAFERSLALQDSSTFQVARNTIDRLADGFHGAEIVIVRVPEAGDTGVIALSHAPLRMEDLPDLSDLRVRLRELAARIATDEDLSGWAE
jgi:hypothetical protein